MQNTKANAKARIFTAVKITVMVLFWGGILLLWWKYRKEISVESITNFVPGNIAAAIAVMLLLFALKGVLITVYGGILYAASGILFPLPTALLVNTAGTILMTGVPFFIGKRTETKLLDKLIQKNGRLRQLQSIESQNEFFISFAVRMIGLLPGDLVGMYLGASNFRASSYFLGTVLGLLPSILAFTVIGMSAHDISSPVFWIAAGGEIAITAFSLAFYLIWKKKQSERRNTL